MAKPETEYILIRFGELSTKGKNRKMFVRTLINNIRKQCQRFESIEVKDHFDRILLFLNGAEEKAVCALLSNVFGISSFTPVKVCASNLDAMAELAFSEMKDVEPTTFKVETRRKSKNMPFVSDDVNRKVAGLILSSTQHKVDIHQPHIRIKIEVGLDNTYIGIKTYPGLQGFPIGVGGKAMVLMSGGIDSPVAAYLTMKRGVEIECIHFATPPYTSPQALEKVRQLVRVLTRYQPIIKLHVVDFTDVQLDIYKHIDKRYGVTLMRRAFVDIATRISKQTKAIALITGDSIGQVASQTLESMGVIQAATDLPILRPLVTYDKMEIVGLAEQIGTYAISIQPFEDCCSLFAVKEPKTKPRLYFVQHEEAKCDLPPLVTKATESITTEIITETSEDFL